MDGWIRVSRSEPCQICAKQSWCQRTADGTVAHCMRVESPKEAKSGGWIHKLSEPLPAAIPRKKPKRIEDVSRLVHKMYQEGATVRRRLSRELGVSVRSLEALRVGAGYDDWNGREWSGWPSRDARGRFIGIIRRYDDGAKKTLAGTSNAGVFAPNDWWKTGGEVWIVEGGSDTAACLSHGICAIGRPSNVGGSKVIGKMLNRRAKLRTILVYGENDKKDECPVDCGKRYCQACWPGLYGARKVAGELAGLIGRTVGTAMPIGKDVRGMLNRREP